MAARQLHWLSFSAMRVLLDSPDDKLYFLENGILTLISNVCSYYLRVSVCTFLALDINRIYDFNRLQVFQTLFDMYFKATACNMTSEMGSLLMKLADLLSRTLQLRLSAVPDYVGQCSHWGL